MKLITKISLNHLWLTLLIFIIGAFGAYFFIRSEVNEKVDWKLLGEMREIKRNTTHVADLSNPALNINSHVEAKPIDKAPDFRWQLKDTLIVHFHRRIAEPFRQLQFAHALDSTLMLISLRKNMVESRDLTAGLWRAMGVVAAGLIFVLILSNFIMTKTVWAPFYRTIEKIKKYNLTQNQILWLEKSNTREFDELNSAINKMAARIEDDYRNLKEFTENASHEIQTPLSVIQSKTDLLMQGSRVNATQMKNFHEIEKAVRRLTRLNQSLLLLMKIENRQFTENKKIDFQCLIDAQLEEFNDLIEMKNLDIQKNFSDPLVIPMNPMLSEILIKNLLTNAIKYTTTQGAIKINVEKIEFSISNSGEPLNIPKSKLFERFKKGNQTSDSLGLGLSIVKKICDFHQFRIEYSYQNNFHIFKIYF